MAAQDVRKYHPSAADIINATEYEEDDEDSVNSKKRIRLAQIEKELEKPPIQDIFEIKDKTQSPPLEFYDNDDGYWNDYINKKSHRRAMLARPKAMPAYKH